MSTGQAQITLFTLVICLAQAASAANFGECIAHINNMTIDGKVDNHGRLLPAATSNATAITYDLCLSQCGADQEPFQWDVFSQQFTSWLLPWLALVSQIPFGANDMTYNLESMFLTVGSPTLAAYSLALTALNGRWITGLFAGRSYANVESAVQILSNFQQSPLRLNTDDGLLASLIILPQNDQWWKKLAKSLHYTHTWSISAATSIGWVVIAYIFTIVDYFLQRDPQPTRQTNGGSIGTLWLWLLPIVIGWLQISPKCDSIRLNDAVDDANTLVYVATSLATGPKIREVTETHAISLDFSTTDDSDARLDEHITAPIYNYARFLAWVQAVMMVFDTFDNIRDRNLHNEQIAPGKTLNDRNSGGWRTLTDKQVTDYCLPRQSKGGRLGWRLDHSVWSRMFTASILALILQWGTTGAAVVIVWFTPTIGKLENFFLSVYSLTTLLDARPRLPLSVIHLIWCAFHFSVDDASHLEHPYVLFHQYPSAAVPPLQVESPISTHPFSRNLPSPIWKNDCNTEYAVDLGHKYPPIHW